jgi:hypothetical protein
VENEGERGGWSAEERRKRLKGKEVEAEVED